MKLDNAMNKVVDMGIEIRQQRHLIEFLRAENKGLQEVIAMQDVLIASHEALDTVTAQRIKEMNKVKIK